MKTFLTVLSIMIGFQGVASADSTPLIQKLRNVRTATSNALFGVAHIGSPVVREIYSGTETYESGETLPTGGWGYVTRTIRCAVVVERDELGNLTSIYMPGRNDELSVPFNAQGETELNFKIFANNTADSKTDIDPLFRWRFHRRVDAVRGNPEGEYEEWNAKARMNVDGNITSLHASYGHFGKKEPTMFIIAAHKYIKEIYRNCSNLELRGRVSLRH